jgi:uncharacterized protein GlcG (DUF336 family)
MTARALGLGALMLLVTACGGGSGPDAVGTDVSNPACAGDCASPAAFLTEADVERVITQAVFEAQAHGATATIAVVDRVGNVLGVFRMAPLLAQTVLLTTHDDHVEDEGPIDGGLEGIRLPTAAASVAIDDQAAIAKAITGAYLSSEGNAFSTRTAGQIVQEHFNPGEFNQPAGPLFGVQFSQLACSDVTLPFNGGAPDAGPKRSPLGLAADPGGFPLYKDGTVVGGVGVIADGIYGIDKVVSDLDRNLDEMIAYAATFGFAAPLDRRGDRITVEGKTLRFSDVGFGDLASAPANAPAFSSLPPAAGSLTAVTGYADAAIRAGVSFGSSISAPGRCRRSIFPRWSIRWSLPCNKRRMAALCRPKPVPERMAAMRMAAAPGSTASGCLVSTIPSTSPDSDSIASRSPLKRSRAVTLRSRASTSGIGTVNATFCIRSSASSPPSLAGS